MQGKGAQVFPLQERNEEHTVQQPTVLLARLSKMAQKPEVQFDKLFQKLYNVELWLLAYQSIAPKPGNMTAGVDGNTIDKAGLRLITELIADLKASRYTPCPTRRVYIPKANGKLRPLGIPMVRSYCPPYGKLSGLCCQGGSDQPIHPGSTVAYFACVDEHLVVSNGAEPACGARR
jgi:hypothetical protein